MYDEVLPEDGSIRAETCKRVLIIVHVFYCIRAFCWYVKDKITVRKMHGMERLQTIGAQQGTSVNMYLCLYVLNVSMVCSASKQSRLPFQMKFK